jgi:hypothetical protein
MKTRACAPAGAAAASNTPAAPIATSNERRHRTMACGQHGDSRNGYDRRRCRDSGSRRLALPASAPRQDCAIAIVMRAAAARRLDSLIDQMTPDGRVPEAGLLDQASASVLKSLLG